MCEHLEQRLFDAVTHRNRNHSIGETYPLEYLQNGVNKIGLLFEHQRRVDSHMFCNFRFNQSKVEAIDLFGECDKHTHNIRLIAFSMLAISLAFLPTRCVADASWRAYVFICCSRPMCWWMSPNLDNLKWIDEYILDTFCILLPPPGRV